MSEPINPAQELVERLRRGYGLPSLTELADHIEAQAKRIEKLERELAEAREWADVAQVARQELIKENDQVKRELVEESERVESLHKTAYALQERAETAERELAETKAALSKLCDIVNTLKRVHESDNQINQQLRESTEQALEKEKHQRAEDEAQYALDLQRERDEAYERAAKACDRKWINPTSPYAVGCIECAATIRALSKPQDTSGKA